MCHATFFLQGSLIMYFFSMDPVVYKCVELARLSGGRLKNACKLLNLRALNFQHCIKTPSFLVWVKYFVRDFKGSLWNLTQNILPIHCKIWFHNKIEILRALKGRKFFKCSQGKALLCNQSMMSQKSILDFLVLDKQLCQIRLIAYSAYTFKKSGKCWSFSSI